MKRIVTAVAVGMLLCAFGARAERYQSSRPNAKHVLVGLDTEFGIPLGDYSDVNSVGAGALVVAEMPVMNMRSEEHTSELQSRPHLVCRLLLEKKKKTKLKGKVFRR